MSIGIATAIGLTIGAAYGAAIHELTLYVAIGATVGAALDIFVQLVIPASKSRKAKI
jgi:hypothetical protein